MKSIPRRSFIQAVGASLAAPSFSAVAGEKSKHILIANAWHCINIGDIAHAPGLLNLIQKHLPGTTVTLWPVPSTRPGHPRELEPHVRKMLLAAWPELNILQAGNVNTSGPARRPDLADAIDRADLFIVGSGGMHVEPAEVWQASTDKPYGFYGVTVGSVSNTKKTLLSDAAFVYCRDSVSVENLRQAGITGPNIGFGPDSVFGFQLRDEERAKNYLNAKSLIEKQFICVVPRHRFSPYQTIYQYPPTEQDREVDRVNHEFSTSDHAAAREMIIQWVRTTGMKVLACPEMTYGVSLAKEQLLDPLPNDVKKNVVWRDSFWNADEAASIYSRAIVVISLDCHSPIISLAAGTPAIHLRVPTDNAHKSQMFADIGLRPWLHELDGMTGTRLAELVMEIHRDPVAARLKVEAAMARVHKRQAETMLTIHQLLG